MTKELENGDDEDLRNFLRDEIAHERRIRDRIAAAIGEPRDRRRR
jgi:hypothetical protein